MAEKPASSRDIGHTGETLTRYELLTFLRGLTALWILGFHMYYLHNLSSGKSQALISQIVLIRPGTHLFFLISGYCVIAMAQNSLRKGESAGRFLGRRLVRIYLPFLGSLAVLILARMFIRLEAEFGAEVDRSLSIMPNLTWLEWVRTLTLTQIFFAPGSDISGTFVQTNPVLWFVAIMVQIYVVVAVALASGRLFWWVLGGVTLVALPFAVTPSAYGSGILLPFWPFFFLGSLLYVLVNHALTPGRLLGRKARPVCLAILASTAACVVYGMFTVFEELYHGYLRLAVALCFLLALWSARVLEEPIRRFSASKQMALVLPMKLLGGLGAMSFSIYLLHWPLLQALKPLINAISPVDNLLFKGILCVAALILLCYPFYRYFERPLQKAKPARSGVPSLAHGNPAPFPPLVCSATGPSPSEKVGSCA